jgi:Lon protease-like protein
MRRFNSDPRLSLLILTLQIINPALPYNMQLPDRVGIMALPNSVLFPQALLPLYIFEARYRMMLNKTLEDERMFAIAMCDPDLQPYRIGSVGLVRACVHNPDGTANLVLQGVARVRFKRIVRKNPYHIAEIEPLDSLLPIEPEMDQLAAQIMAIVVKARAQGEPVPDWMTKFLDELRDHEVLCDLVAHTFIIDPLTKQAILEELNIHRRLHRVLEALQAQSTSSGFSFE